MPLDDLVSVIETLQQRIRDHGPALRENETRTRMALIDPLLQALGWDTSDPAVVMPERPVSSGRADYALLASNGNPVAFVEAKSLGTPLENDRSIDQLVRYAFTDGIPYAILTDGSSWHSYDLNSPGMAFKDRRILYVSIADDLANEIVLKLLLLWRPNLSSGQPVPASEPILTAEPEPPLVPTVSESIGQPMLATNPSAIGWVPLSSFAHTGVAKVPSLIRFSDGSEHPMQYWRHLVQRTASWLWSKGLLTQDNLPVPVPGGSRHVASTQPIHKSGRSFIEPRYIEGEAVVIEGRVSSNGAMRNTKALLNHCGVNPADVFVQAAPSP